VSDAPPPVRPVAEPGSVPPSPSAPGAALRALGLRPRKRLSQSFLRDERVVRDIVRAAELTPEDEVLEVGPGLGILTRALTRAAGRVVAVELDPRLAAALPGLVNAPNLTVVQQDILQFAPEEVFAGDYKVVANLPYHITSPTLFHLLFRARPPRIVVVTVQREVAERIAAAPGRLSYLAVALQLVAEVQPVRRIPPSAFRPRPQVESMVLKLVTRRAPAVPVDDVQRFLATARAGFAQPRKQVLNSLAQGLGQPRAAVAAVLDEADVAPILRPEQLSLAQWAAIDAALAKRGMAVG
jgi:16S rRNA (adenine1518-N6/adenine1519-N6)-dimethyltransferase